jgi:hemerythrin-like metal-binding protein
MKLAWTPDLATGHPEIDAQHRALFDTARTIIEAQEQGAGGPDLERLLDVLDRYVVDHFATEEAVMRAAGYPLEPQHLMEHGYFASGVQKLRRRLEGRGAGPEAVPLVRDFLADWLAGHVADSDRDLARHLSLSSAAGGAGGRKN